MGPTVSRILSNYFDLLFLFFACVKISTEAQGKSWSAELSPARHYVPHMTQGRLNMSTSSPRLSSQDSGSRSGSGAAKMTSTRSFTSAADSSIEESFGLSRSVSLTAGTQRDRLSGNVGEFDSCQGNVRDFTESQGNVVREMCLLLAAYLHPFLTLLNLCISFWFLIMHCCIPTPTGHHWQ